MDDTLLPLVAGWAAGYTGSKKHSFRGYLHNIYDSKGKEDWPKEAKAQKCKFHRQVEAILWKAHSNEARPNVVREGGIEPPRAEAHKILSLGRLPVPPLPQVQLNL